MSNLTPTQTTILQAAAERPDGAIHPLPNGIQGGAALKVITAMRNKGLIQDQDNNDWRISDQGYQAIGREKAVPVARDPLTTLFEKIALDHLFIDTLETRKSDDLDFHEVSVWAVKSALEAAYQAGAASAKQQRKPAQRGERRETKQARMIELLKRPDGATVAQIAAATGWNAATVRGAIAGTLKKRLGLNVSTQRLRVVGPGRQGSPGSYTTYHIPAEGDA